MSGQSALTPASNWERQPNAWLFLHENVERFCHQSRVLATWRQRLLNETGTRLIDWLDHMTLGTEAATDDQLLSFGFIPDPSSDQPIWRHPKGLFPAIKRPSPDRCVGAAIKVEAVADFFQVHGAADGSVLGHAEANFRMATVDRSPGATLWIVERHGNRGFCPLEPSVAQREMLARARELFRGRSRMQQGFATARQAFDVVAETLGGDWACDLFFAAERDYWQSRNHAARMQKRRQDALGLGWANHDHHTYRCSREHFASLVAILEHFGFVCRERFYAGAQAGWGAQVMEQPACGLVVFADVDLSPDEVAGDFAHQGLAPRGQLGTVGLWCKLHGESFLSAGMHHLECQFDFDAAREQLAAAGIKTMAPFTDFTFLRQAFTQGEQWSVAVPHLKQLVQQNWITSKQADEFAAKGALGSHLEILERNDGYKGFNQTGVSDIIHRTDPRRQISS